MVRMISVESIKGASHIRSEKPCEDSYHFEKITDDTLILAVADGHGSSSCPFSKTGSRIAANVFCSVMKNLLNNFSDNSELLMTYLNREGDIKVAQAVEEEWKRRVWKAHLDNKREKPLDNEGKTDKAAVYRMYGTTLLGVLMTSEFMFAFQIGDGDIMHLNGKTVESVIDADKILGIETHSLSSANAWKNALSVMQRFDSDNTVPELYMISTDGFANSYSTDINFKETCCEYYTMIKEHGFEAVSENLKDWLNETSELGCGDDITVALIYCY